MQQKKERDTKLNAIILASIESRKNIYIDNTAIASHSGAPHMLL